MNDLEGAESVHGMVRAFSNEERCREILESMTWPDGPTCPKCGSRRHSTLRDRDMGGKERPGVRNCLDCGKRYTVTSHTPMHSTKLPLSKWLTAIWMILQSDKGISSVRLAQLIGISQKTAWRMGHAIRLMMAPGRPLDGIVEADIALVGGAPRKDPSDPDARRGKQGDTSKKAVLVAVERPGSRDPDDPDDGPKASGTPMAGRSSEDVAEAFEGRISSDAHLMTDAGTSFSAPGSGFAAHDTVVHGAMEFSRGIVSANGAEGFTDRIRRTVVGVFHHIDPLHAPRYFDEVGWRWGQRRADGTVTRKTRKGRVRAVPKWERISIVGQMRKLLARAVGCEGRRTRAGGFMALCVSSPFGL